MTARRLTLKPSVALESEEHEDGGVLIDSHSATLCSCNESAWMLLNSLQAGATADELVDVIVEKFSLAKVRARRDVLEFINRLDVMGFLDDAA